MEVKVKETLELQEQGNDIIAKFDGHKTITFKRGDEIIIVYKLYQAGEVNLSEAIRIVDMK